VDDVLAVGALAGSPRLGSLPLTAHRAFDIARHYASAGLFPADAAVDDLERLWDELSGVRAHGVLEAFALVEDAAYAATRIIRYFEALERAGVPDLFLRSAGLGQEHKVSSELAPYLERLMFRRARSVDVPGWLELAAWALDASVREGTDFIVDACGVCGVPWLRTGTSRYCRRLAPGSWQTCAQLAKVREHRQRRASLARAQAPAASGDQSGGTRDRGASSAPSA
jgi:hypothetical protein